MHDAHFNRILWSFLENDVSLCRHSVWWSFVDASLAFFFCSSSFHKYEWFFVRRLALALPLMPVKLPILNGRRPDVPLSRYATLMSNIYQCLRQNLQQPPPPPMWMRSLVRARVWVSAESTIKQASKQHHCQFIITFFTFSNFLITQKVFHVRETAMTSFNGSMSLHCAGCCHRHSSFRRRRPFFFLISFSRCKRCQAQKAVIVIIEVAFFQRSYRFGRQKSKAFAPGKRVNHSSHAAHRTDYYCIFVGCFCVRLNFNVTTLFFFVSFVDVEMAENRRDRTDSVQASFSVRHAMRFRIIIMKCRLSLRWNFMECRTDWKFSARNRFRHTFICALVCLFECVFVSTNVAWFERIIFTSSIQSFMTLIYNCRLQLANSKASTTKLHKWSNHRNAIARETSVRSIGRTAETKT